MRFFLFSLFFYFNTLFLDIFNDFYNLKIDNILFSNDIRLNIDKIPHRNNLIIKKFDITKFNFKQKTKISNKFASTYTDSKIDNIKTKEKLVLARLPLLKDVNDVIFDNRPLLEKNENIYSSKNFKQIANNLEDSNKEPFVGLNILETINKAINYNPKIKAQKFSYESSKENIKQVYSAIFPSIEMNLSKGYKDTDSSTSDIKINESVSPQDFSINLEQNLYTGGKFTAEAKKAKSQLLIEEENLRLIRYEIILESALAYLNVLEKKN